MSGQIVILGQDDTGTFRVLPLAYDDAGNTVIPVVVNPGALPTGVDLAACSMPAGEGDYVPVKMFGSYTYNGVSLPYAINQRTINALQAVADPLPVGTTTYSDATINTGAAIAIKYGTVVGGTTATLYVRRLMEGLQVVDVAAFALTPVTNGGEILYISPEFATVPNASQRAVWPAVWVIDVVVGVNPLPCDIQLDLYGGV